MSQASERLERYLTDVEGCTPGAIEDRLAELDELETRADEGAASAVETLDALADDTRFRLVRALVLADEPLCVCEIHPLLEVSESAVSHALSELAEAGLVAGHSEGRWRHYEATDRAERLVVAAPGADPSTAGDDG